MSDSRSKHLRRYIWPKKSVHRFALFACLVACGATIPVAFAKPDISKLSDQTIKISATKIAFHKETPVRKRFGKLIWRGGIAITSNSPYFGGFSGLAISKEGNELLSVSDAGFWMMARLGERDGSLSSIEDARIGPLIDAKRTGKKLGKQRDAESIALEGDKLTGGQALVSFEIHHRIDRYEIGRTDLKRKKWSYRPPRAQKDWSPNNAMEAIEVIQAGPQKGAIIAFLERYKDKKGNLSGFLLKKGKQEPIALKPIKGFDISGAAALPDGGLLLLERRFRMREGVKIRIRYIPAADIKPGAILKGETLLEADSTNYFLDNMEGIAAHQLSSGETIITLISDDNFNFFQRTLIIQFSWPDTRKKRVSKE